MNIKEQFGERLRKLRNKQGWTQAEMAHRIGIDRSYISEAESGKRNVCLLNMKAIADGLGITLAQLFSGLK
jgi:transcriptional regulator with XRE-family HTH domain